MFIWMTASNVFIFFPVWLLPETAKWGHYVTASWVPYHEHYVIRSFPLCRVQFTTPHKICNSNVNAADAIKKKRENRHVPWLSSSRTSSERHVFQCRCQPTPTQPKYLYTKLTSRGGWGGKNNNKSGLFSTTYCIAKEQANKQTHYSMSSSSSKLVRHSRLPLTRSTLLPPLLPPPPAFSATASLLFASISLMLTPQFRRSRAWNRTCP